MSESQGVSSINPDVDNPRSDTQIDATTSDQAMTGSASPSDSASTLRAAALLTLKSKRRKPATDQPSSPSHRPIPPGLVLNYGEEESTSTPSTAAPPSAITKTATSLTKTTTSEAEDNREEGEISDTESTPPKPKASNKKALKSKAIPTDKKSTSKTSPTLANSPATPKPPSDPEKKTESAPATPVAGPSFLAAQPQTPYVVDSDHVRPGLAMNEQQYDAAKDIVLDLLGWGVDPEYIVDTGVSREIIFYVFTELHLRLPRNLVTTGLIPFYPSSTELAPQVTPAATQTRRQRSNSSAAAMPPPPSIPPRHDAPPFTPGRVSHPSLPQKPHAPQGNPPVSPVLVSRSNSGPPTQLTVLTNVREIEQQRKQAGAETDLHEIEQLRKQELIARKAVQASRKNKAAPNAAGQSPSLVSPSLALSESKDKDIDMAGVVPAEFVDDFLKSIGPVPEADNGQGADGAFSSNGAVRHSSATPAPMDVDEIPGFSVGHGDASLSRPLSGASGPLTEPPPSSTDSNSGFSEAPSTETGGSHQLKEDIPPGEHDFQQSDPGRRGIKRPVASDFVDFESAPSRASNGYPNGGASQPPSLRRKTTGSFASVSGMRRCVIDLSDSEDDGDGEAHRMESERGQRIYSPLPTRAHAATPSMPHVANGGDWTLPLHHISNGKSGTQSPAALLAKEEEIKKMRELIAKREQSRLKKLVAMSRPTSAPVNDSSAAPQVTPPLSDLASTIKQEEADLSTGLTPSPPNGGSHLVNGHSHNASEQIKMHGVSEPRRQDSGSTIPISELAAVTSGSPSASATPPIADAPDPNTMENVNTGEQVLTTEAQQEQVDTYAATRLEQSASAAVDVNDSPSSSSTQVSQTRFQQQQALEKFPIYDSPFESYPLLRSRLRRILPGDSPMALQDQRQQEVQPSYSAISSSSSLPSFISFSSLPYLPSIVSPSFIPDLKPLKKAASFKALDPSKQICQYELPGGGVCRDEGCQNVHLSRGLDGLGVDDVEPSDEDTAEYLFDVLSSANDDPSWLTQERRVTVATIQGALQGLRGIGKGYEERVAEALATLQPPPPAI